MSHTRWACVIEGMVMWSKQVKGVFEYLTVHGQTCCRCARLLQPHRAGHTNRATAHPSWCASQYTRDRLLCTPIHCSAPQAGLPHP